MEAGQDNTKEPRLQRPKLQRDLVPQSLSAADGNNSIDMAIQRMSSRSNPNVLSKNADSTLASANGVSTMRGMVLPFTSLVTSFDKVNYYVDMPAEMKAQGAPEDKLQLLWEVTGASYGSLFARIFGYCEQNDIQSPLGTVKESLIYSAFLRLPKEVSNDEKMIYNGDDYNGLRIVSRAYELRDAVHGMLSQMDPALVGYCDKIASQGGTTLMLEELGGSTFPSTPVVQLGTITRASARLRNVQPDVNLD